MGVIGLELHRDVIITSSVEIDTRKMQIMFALAIAFGVTVAGVDKDGTAA